jgi:hypothetical protein
LGRQQHKHWRGDAADIQSIVPLKSVPNNHRGATAGEAPLKQSLIVRKDRGGAYVLITLEHLKHIEGQEEFYQVFQSVTRIVVTGTIRRTTPQADGRSASRSKKLNSLLVATDFHPTAPLRRTGILESNEVRTEEGHRMMSGSAR